MTPSIGISKFLINLRYKTDVFVFLMKWCFLIKLNGDNLLSFYISTWSHKFHSFTSYFFFFSFFGVSRFSCINWCFSFTMFTNGACMLNFCHKDPREPFKRVITLKAALLIKAFSFLCHQIRFLQAFSLSTLNRQFYIFSCHLFEVRCANTYT